MKTMLEVTGLEQRFRLTRSLLDSLQFRKGRLVREEKVCHAVNGINFKVMRGKTFSLVGESGCGKTTTARMIIRLLEPKAGRILFDGNDITHMTQKEILPFRKQIQMIFQDPYASLNPREKIIDIITAPMLLHGIVKTKDEAVERGIGIFRKVGIREEQASRFPHQFSGGQRQRVGIARALAVNPSFIVADEPVSALDVSIQAQILNLLMDLQTEFHFSYLFIAHDLSVVRHISDEIGVMYLGKIVEQGEKKQIFGDPKHPYTQALLASTPKITGDNLEKSKPLLGEIPSSVELPSGCLFHERCPYKKPICSEIHPEEKFVEEGHAVSCHLY